MGVAGVSQFLNESQNDVILLKEKTNNYYQGDNNNQ